MGLNSMGYFEPIVSSALLCCKYFLNFHSFRMRQWAHSLPDLQVQWQQSESTLLVSLSLFPFIEVQGSSHSTFSCVLPKQSVSIWSAVNWLFKLISSTTGIGFMPHMGHAANLGSHDILVRQMGQKRIGLISGWEHFVVDKLGWWGSPTLS